MSFNFKRNYIVSALLLAITTSNQAFATNSGFAGVDGPFNYPDPTPTSTTVPTTPTKSATGSDAAKGECGQKGAGVTTCVYTPTLDTVLVFKAISCGFAPPVRDSGSIKTVGLPDKIATDANGKQILAGKWGSTGVTLSLLGYKHLHNKCSAFWNVASTANSKYDDHFALTGSVSIDDKAGYSRPLLLCPRSETDDFGNKIESSCLSFLSPAEFKKTNAKGEQTSLMSLLTGCTYTTLGNGQVSTDCERKKVEGFGVKIYSSLVKLSAYMRAGSLPKNYQTASGEDYEMLRFAFKIVNASSLPIYQALNASAVFPESGTELIGQLASIQSDAMTISYFKQLYKRLLTNSEALGIGSDIAPLLQLYSNSFSNIQLTAQAQNTNINTELAAAEALAVLINNLNNNVTKLVMREDFSQSRSYSNQLLNNAKK